MIWLLFVWHVGVAAPTISAYDRPVDCEMAMLAEVMTHRSFRVACQKVTVADRR
jgi:hypothetical protein